MIRILMTMLLFLGISSLQHFSLAADVKGNTPRFTSTVPELPSPTPVSIPPSDNKGYVFPLENLVEAPAEETDRFYSEFFNMLATLGIIIGIILIAAWMLKRLLNTRLEQINTTSTIKIIERRSLSPKTAIYLLEIYDKIIAVAETTNGITPLGEFTDSSNHAENENLPSSFNKILEDTKPGGNMRR